MLCRSKVWLPMLQSESSRACVFCDGQSAAFCSRCGITPYCSTSCQKLDWTSRHRSVCNKLISPSKPSATTVASVETLIPPIAPLRHPHNYAAKDLGQRENSVEKTPQQSSSPSGPVVIGPLHNRLRQGFSQNNKPQNNQNPRLQNNTQQEKVNSYYQPRGKPKDGGQQKNKRQENKSPKHRPQEKVPVRKSREEKVEGEWCLGENLQLVQAMKMQPTKTLPNQIAKQTPVVRTVNQNVPIKEPEPKIEEKIVLKVATVGDVTPSKKIVPKKYMVEMLSCGDAVMLSVDSKASACKTKGDGFVCLSLHENYESEYAALCEEYSMVCDKDAAKYTPTPGETFSYLNPEDGAWYRARCLNASLAALIDSSKVVSINPQDKLKQLPEKYAEFPEFSCLLNAKGVQIGDNLKCTLAEKIKDGYMVLIENTEKSGVVLEGQVLRWRPEVEFTPSKLIAGGPLIPEVPRPELRDGIRVVLVEVQDLPRALVRRVDSASQRRYDSVMHDVVLFGRGATPLDVPPQKGQMVVAKYTDGLHYRALCKRTNVKQNKYLIEYIESGNLEIANMENLYPCPAEFDLASQPAEASLVTLRSDITVVTTAAVKYIETLKDSATELILNICDGAKTAPSGAEVNLTVADTRVSVNKRLQELCTPEWKKMEMNGVDVVEVPKLMYSDLEYLELPKNGCEIEILDISALEGAMVSGFLKGEPLAKKVLEELPKQIEAYCNSEIGKEPYLPKCEELCIAQCPPYSQWFRAVLCEHVDGAGGDTVRVSFVDYGNMESVQVRALRKMLPDFVNGIPALAINLEIRDFPPEPSLEMLARAVQHMKINDEGRGFLTITSCEMIDRGMYVVDAPALIAAMKG